MPLKLGFIDNLVSCKIPEEDSTDENDLMRRKHVLELQQHGHSPTCKKKRTECRFDFPRLPSERTMIAKPITGTEKEIAKKLEKYTVILANAKEVLKQLPTAKEVLNQGGEETISMDEFYKRIGVSKEDYEEALGSTTKGYMIILERKVSDRWTNNFHPLWLCIWNANMDIQIGKNHLLS